MNRSAHYMPSASAEAHSAVAICPTVLPRAINTQMPIASDGLQIQASEGNEARRYARYITAPIVKTAMPVAAIVNVDIPIQNRAVCSGRLFAKRSADRRRYPTFSRPRGLYHTAYRPSADSDRQGGVFAHGVQNRDCSDALSQRTLICANHRSFAGFTAQAERVNNVAKLTLAFDSSEQARMRIPMKAFAVHPRLADSEFRRYFRGQQLGGVPVHSSPDCRYPSTNTLVGICPLQY